ncbi:hypothetical protein [Brevibacillus porteri]|uniref:hypothetical protein n=1 Tax=Brevibacillus porteri TaxID=2126350 RepID=UPI001FC9F958|nr:hypothetical protein [Brevibacillus porteri]MED1797305.1 hypothetical protein [Brevibacillus porteri]MED2129375.1 hypothetical protein [Brevibacillus porteri]MED2743073.1 hypothetical protein [Brevibacillus porteri]MED2817774.1 hypothetical protein [Brevibacillus porteri]MED2896831.1 hypothetical protein [Brevibacillus porteri]
MLNIMTAEQLAEIVMHKENKFTMSHEKISEVDSISDPERISQLDLAVLND